MRALHASGRGVTTALVVVTSSVCGACRGSTGAAQAFPSSAAEAPSQPAGAYEYTAHLPGGHQLKGVVAVLRDTIILEPATGQCRPARGAANPEGVLYECSADGRYERVTFWVDKYSTQRWRWTASERVTVSRRVCVVYDTRFGRRVCVREETRIEEVSVPHRGALEVRRRLG